MVRSGRQHADHVPTKVATARGTDHGVSSSRSRPECCMAIEHRSQAGHQEDLLKTTVRPVVVSPLTKTITHQEAARKIASSLAGRHRGDVVRIPRPSDSR